MTPLEEKALEALRRLVGEISRVHRDIEAKHPAIAEAWGIAGGVLIPTHEPPARTCSEVHPETDIFHPGGHPEPPAEEPRYTREEAIAAHRAADPHWPQTEDDFVAALEKKP